MPQGIKPIALPLPLRLGSVNCYLIDTGAAFLLVDTGGSDARAALDRALDQARCLPGILKLILITHGDFDHTGNAAYLRSRFGAPIAMHPADVGMAERGDMFWNRKKGSRLLGTLSPLLFGFGRSSRFSPDFTLNDGYDLSLYGLDARVLSLPGHSAGSIGILTTSGELLCGDLFENVKAPRLNSLMDDPVAAAAALARLRGLGVRTVYPGHGRPFGLNALQT